MWRLGSLLPALVAAIFEAVPSLFIWQWAEKNVFLEGKSNATPGFYRSRQTPWTRRIQELAQHPWHNGVRVRKIVVKKSSQSGYSEAVLNIIRWCAKFSPRNVIYAIDTRDEAANVAERLTSTLARLGERIFSDDSDDIGKYTLRLRRMIVWFFGSFSAGKFANKQAPLCVADEVEEHAQIHGDTSTVTNLESRMKTADNGLLILLSKPKLKGGLIDREHRTGNQEEWEVPCPRDGCGQFQELVLGQLKFGHCKNLLGEWERRRILTEIFYECRHCKQPIYEREKEWMNDRGRWRATAEDQAIPGVISQHIGDICSYNPDVAWPQLAFRIIAAKGNRKERQGIRNHIEGLEWEEQAAKTEAKDILACKKPYKRGTIPFVPRALLLGGDVGLDYARWVVGAIGPGAEMAIVDWGSELHPDGVRDVLTSESWPEAAHPDVRHQVLHGFLDAKYRKEDSYGACLQAKGRMWPCAGGGGPRSRQSFAYGQLPGYPKWFGLVSFNDRDFKSELYIDLIARQSPPFMVPEDVDAEFIMELCNERLQEDEDAPTAGIFEWKRFGPNHYGDCVKLIRVGWRYLTRQRQPVATQPKPETAGDSRGEP